jgi:pumilio RNA-binding family
MENVNKLSADKFGNYVVQQLVEHGGHAMRSTMVSKFAGRVVSMSYHKFASNVVEKCLTFGSQEDRRLIADEIVGAGGGQHFDHLVVRGRLALRQILLSFTWVQCASCFSLMTHMLCYMCRI